MPIRFKTEEERKNHPLAKLINDKTWFDIKYFNGELDELSEQLLSKAYDFFHKEDCQLPQNQAYSIKHLYCIILRSQDLTLKQCQYFMEKMSFNHIDLAEVLMRTQCSEPLEDLIESNLDENSLKQIYSLAIRHNDLKSLKILEKKFVNNGKDKAYITKFLAENDFEVYSGAILSNSLSILEHFHSHLDFNFKSQPAALLTKSLNLLRSSAQHGGTDCISGLTTLFTNNSITPEQGYYEAFTLATLNAHINYLRILVGFYKPSFDIINTLYQQVIMKHDQPMTLKFLESISPFNPILFFDFEKKQDNWYTLALQYERKEVFFHLLTKNIDAILHFAHSNIELAQQYIKDYMIMMLNTDLEDGEEEDQKLAAFITILTFLKHNPNFLINDQWPKLLEIDVISEFIHAEEIRQGINTNHSSNPINAPDPIESSDKTLPQIESKVADNPVQEALINDMLPLQPDPEKIAQNSITHVIATAYTKYEQHTRGIRFCLFHIHGEKGIARANKFKQTFNENQTLQEQYHQVLAYLQDDTNGNTHPHSFRTMLLAKLLNKDLSSNEALRDISEGFSTYLEQYRSCFTLNNLSNLNNN